MIKRGIAPASALIIIVAITKQNSQFLPGNLYFAKAKPASAQKNKVVTVPIIVENKLLYKFDHTGISSNNLQNYQM